MTSPLGEKESKRPVRTLRRGVGWTVLFRGVTVGSTVIVASLVSHFGGAPTLGEYFVLLSVAGVVSTFVSLGLPTTLVRRVAQALDRAEARSALAASARALLLATSAAGVVLGLGMDRLGLALGFGDWGLMHAIAVVAWSLGMASNALLSAFYQGAHSFGLSTFFAGACASATAIVLIGVVGRLYGSITPLLVAGVFAVSTIVASAAAWGTLGTLRSPPSVTNRPRHWRSTSLIQESWAQYGMSITLLIATQLDLWFVSAAMGAGDAGRYALALKLALFVSLPLTVISGVLMPIIARELKLGRLDEVGALVRFVSLRASIASAFICVGVVMISPYILPRGFNVAASSENLAVLMVLCIAQVGSVVVGPCGEVLLMCGRAARVFAITLVTGALAAFVAYFGAVNGALVVVASGAAGALLLQRVLLMLSCRRYTGISTFALDSFPQPEAFPYRLRNNRKK